MKISNLCKIIQIRTYGTHFWYVLLSSNKCVGTSLGSVLVLGAYTCMETTLGPVLACINNDKIGILHANFRNTNITQAQSASMVHNIQATSGIMDDITITHDSTSDTCPDDIEQEN